MADFDGGLAGSTDLGSSSPVLVVSGGGVTLGIAPNPDPPVVADFEPAPGTTIDALQVLEFDVTDDGPLAAVFVSALFPSGAHEVVWDGEAFAPRYAAGSARTELSGGLHFAVRRSGGWRAESVTIKVLAVDSSGNLGAAEESFP